MTFDEWAKENWMYIDVKENARVIWDAAASAEREACALIVCPVPHVEEERECSDIASVIRMRSNAEITDSALLRSPA